MRMHLQEQVGKYGSTTLVNLINHKGHEKPIKEAYERVVRQVDLPDVRYQYFDFHAECSRMRWDRISLLLEDVEEDLIEQGYFHLDAAQDAPVKLQRGVIRTNCMDNLDRTNVTQAAFAKWNLDRQLKSLGVMDSNDSISLHEDLDSVFRSSGLYSLQVVSRNSQVISVVGPCESHLNGIQWHSSPEDRLHSDRQAHTPGCSRGLLQVSDALPQEQLLRWPSTGKHACTVISRILN
jgi:hypothetical protein